MNFKFVMNKNDFKLKMYYFTIYGCVSFVFVWWAEGLPVGRPTSGNNVKSMEIQKSSTLFLKILLDVCSPFFKCHGLKILNFAFLLL